MSRSGRASINYSNASGSRKAVGYSGYAWLVKCLISCANSAKDSDLFLMRDFSWTRYNSDEFSDPNLMFKALTNAELLFLSPGSKSTITVKAGPLRLVANSITLVWSSHPSIWDIISNWSRYSCQLVLPSYDEMFLCLNGNMARLVLPHSSHMVSTFGLKLLLWCLLYPSNPLSISWWLCLTYLPAIPDWTGVQLLTWLIFPPDSFLPGFWFTLITPKSSLPECWLISIIPASSVHGCWFMLIIPASSLPGCWFLLIIPASSLPGCWFMLIIPAPSLPKCWFILIIPASSLLGCWFMLIIPASSFLKCWFMLIIPASSLIGCWFMLIIPASSLLGCWFMLIIPTSSLLGCCFMLIIPASSLPGCWFMLIIRTSFLLWCWFMLIIPASSLPWCWFMLIIPASPLLGCWFMLIIPASSFLGCWFMLIIPASSLLGCWFMLIIPASSFPGCWFMLIIPASSLPGCWFMLIIRASSLLWSWLKLFNKIESDACTFTLISCVYFSSCLPRSVKPTCNESSCLVFRLKPSDLSTRFLWPIEAACSPLPSVYWSTETPWLPLLAATDCRCFSTW